MPENNRLLQTRVTPLVDERVKHLAAASGCSVATWLRQLVIRKVAADLSSSPRQKSVAIYGSRARRMG